MNTKNHRTWTRLAATAALVVGTACAAQAADDPGTGGGSRGYTPNGCTFEGVDPAYPPYHPMVCGRS